MSSPWLLVGSGVGEGRLERGVDKELVGWAVKTRCCWTMERVLGAKIGRSGCKVAAWMSKVTRVADERVEKYIDF